MGTNTDTEHKPGPFAGIPFEDKAASPFAVATVPLPQKDDRTPTGQFAPGKSGNPAGRPKGTATGALRQQLAEHAPAVIDKAIRLALAGDVMAIRLVLERVLPALKPQAAPVSVDLEGAQGLAGAGRAIVTAAAEGRLSPDAAGELMRTVASLARVIETDELERRIAALEAQPKPPPETWQ